MKDSLTDTLILLFRNLIPFFITLFFVLVGFVPTHLPLSHFLRPDFALICIYFWVLYRLDLFGIVSTILIGVVVDSLSGLPLGMNICVFLFVYLLTITLAGYVNTKPFVSSWLCFSLIAFLAFVLKWFLFCVYFRTLLTLPHIFMTYVSTILIYPLIARLNMFIQNRYIKTRGDIDE